MTGDRIDPAAIEDRPASPGDAEALFALRNEDAVRRASVRTDPIPWDEHRAWYDRALADPARRLRVFERDSRFAGMVRFDVLPGGAEATVHIALSPWLRGQGFAAVALARALRADRARPPRMVALVKPGNDASLRPFARMGFVAAGRADGLVRLELEPARPRAGALTLLRLDQASGADRHAILAIRNEPGVRRNMYTADPIPPDRHAAWLAATLADPAVDYFIAALDGAPVGALAFSRIDRTHARADWAFYLSEGVQGRGLGRAMEAAALRHAFTELALEKLNCEVIASNAAVVRLHERNGFRHEGLRRAHVVREGGVEDAVLMGQLRTEWETGLTGRTTP